MHHARGNKSESSVQSPEPNSKRQAPEEEVRVRAYQIYVSRNRKPGRALEDWLQAERELQFRN
jgi:Protein of unknown function (DUF2934)